ncbi:MAG: thiolase family protein [Alphaproteobacteria bacterium]|nr:thiolase family protein [Alphaproteobacteria bacterium]MDP6567224.1 thiolase family protein [Alphaproteobacteria bacterium]MDP6812948.1 thiolase family protein [Alphaproteobacteria bacterium]
MTKVYVVGVGMTPFGRLLERSVKDLTAEAVNLALGDAGAAIADIGAAYFSNTTQGLLEGQHLVPAQMALRGMGFEGIPMSNVENACASASTAFQHAHMAIKAGVTEVALAVGADKMYHADKARSFEIFDGAWDVHDVDGTLARLAAMGEGVEPDEREDIPDGQRSVFMDVYAAFGKFHMKTFGSTQRQFAAVAAKNHHHSTRNPLSQYQQDYSIDDVLAARTVSWPLTLPMCSPISDGGAAAILCSGDALDRFAEARPVKVHACVLGTGVDRTVEQVDRHITHLTANRAYKAAGLGPRDMSVAEVHDATAIGEVTQTENLGFCAFGEGGRLAERGETAIGGRIPINPSGGLESKGHPIGATGLAQIHELVGQLRGEAGPRQVEGARHAIAENAGGIYGLEESVACITILGR